MSSFYLAAALILAGALAYGVHIYKKAERADAAEQALSDYKAAVKDREKKAADMQSQIDKSRQETTAAIQTVTKAIDDLRAHPPKASVIREQLPGEPCPSLHLDPEWVRDLNQASAIASSVPYPN